MNKCMKFIFKTISTDFVLNTVFEITKVTNLPAFGWGQRGTPASPCHQPRAGELDLPWGGQKSRRVRYF